MQDIGFIGAGTVGTALAVRLREKGYPVIAAASRTRASAERLAGMVDGCKIQDSGQAVADMAEMVFITTPDDAIAEVAKQLKWLQRGRVCGHSRTRHRSWSPSRCLSPPADPGQYRTCHRQYPRLQFCSGSRGAAIEYSQGYGECPSWVVAGAGTW